MLGDPVQELVVQHGLRVGPFAARSWRHGIEGHTECRFGGLDLLLVVEYVAPVGVASPSLGQAAAPGQHVGIVEPFRLHQVPDALAEDPLIAGDQAGQRVQSGQKLGARLADGFRLFPQLPVLVAVVPYAQPPDDFVALMASAREGARQLADPSPLESGLQAAGSVVHFRGVAGGLRHDFERTCEQHRQGDTQGGLDDHHGRRLQVALYLEARSPAGQHRLPRCPHPRLAKSSATKWSRNMSSSRSSQLPVPADPGMIIRDFIVFQLKLAADGLRDVVAINLSIIAIVIDLVAGRGGKFGLFYGVVRLSKRFESWLDLHRMKGIPDEGAWEERFELPGGEADDLIDRFEDLVERKTSEMRVKRDPWDGEG